jgi:hypothetical protein
LPQSLTIEDFEPYIGRNFAVAGRSEILKLVSADRGRATRGLPRIPFSLIFEGARDRIVPEGLYRLSPEDGTDFEVYVIPIMTLSGDRQDYEAVFN